MVLTAAEIGSEIRRVLGNVRSREALVPVLVIILAGRTKRASTHNDCSQIRVGPKYSVRHEVMGG